MIILYHNGPLQNTWFGSTGQAIRLAMWGWTSEVSNYFALDSQNDSLALENVRLRDRISKLEMMVNDSVKSSASYIDSLPGDFSYTPAQIRKISNNTQHNYIILDKGEKDGITTGSGIITGKGVVGIIDAVSDNFSYARSFKNHNTVISARLRHTGPTGSIRWDGESSHKAILHEIPHHISVSAGDTVYTSGFSSIFPADIPLGIVKSSRIVNGSSHKINVELFEDFRSLRYVTVVKNNNLSEITSLEKKQ